MTHCHFSIDLDGSIFDYNIFVEDPRYILNYTYILNLKCAPLRFIRFSLWSLIPVFVSSTSFCLRHFGFSCLWCCLVLIYRNTEICFEASLPHICNSSATVSFLIPNIQDRTAWVLIAPSRFLTAPARRADATIIRFAYLSRHGALSPFCSTYCV